MKGARHRWLVNAERVGRWVEDILTAILLAGLILLASAQIVLRNVFSSGLTWGDGLTRLLVLWLAVVGAIAASRSHKMIAIDLMSRALPEHWRRAVAALTSLFTAVVTGFLTWFSWVFVQDSRAFGDVLFGDWPAWVFQLILPVGFAVICYRYSLRAFLQLGTAD